MTSFTIVRYYKQDKTITRDFLCMGKKRKGSKNDNHVELGILNLLIYIYIYMMYLSGPLIITFAVRCDPSQDSWDYSPHSGLLKHEQSGKCLKVNIACGSFGKF